MRRITLVLALAAIMSTTMVLAGQSLAKTANQNQSTYTDTISGFEYFADPANGIAKFRSIAAGDLEGALDGRFTIQGPLLPTSRIPSLTALGYFARNFRRHRWILLRVLQSRLNALPTPRSRLRAPGAVARYGGMRPASTESPRSRVS